MIYVLILAFLLFLPLNAARAVCPVCTVAVCASVGLSRWLGVDDTITGLWIGGLAVSLSLWTISWLNGKNVKFFGRQPLIFLFYYIISLWPLYQFKLAGIAGNTLWGADKLLLGIIIGSLGFFAGVLADKYFKKSHSNRAYFPFQKVALPIGALAILSLAFYLICTYKLF